MIQTFTAYIDAATISMVFAAVAGVAVTIGTVVAVYFRRAKKAVSDKLGIDENEKKEQEADVIGSFGEEGGNVVLAESESEEKAE